MLIQRIIYMQPRSRSLDCHPNPRKDEEQPWLEQLKQEDLMKTKELLQTKLRRVGNQVLYCQQYLDNAYAKQKEKEKKTLQLTQRLPRVQELLRLASQQESRLENKQAMGLKQKREISQEIESTYEMQIKLAKTNKQKEVKLFREDEVTHIFQKYFPLYESQKQSQSTVNKQPQCQCELRSQTFSLLQKQQTIRKWIEAEIHKRKRKVYEQIQREERIKQQLREREERLKAQLREREERIRKQLIQAQDKINQASIQFKAIKVQQLRLQQKLTKTTDEDEKGEIKVKLYELSLDINDLEYKIQELYKQKKENGLAIRRILLESQKLSKSAGFQTCFDQQSPLQTEWEKIKNQQIQIQQRWEEKKQWALAHRQEDTRRLEQCFSSGKYIRSTNALYIQDTRFYPGESCLQYFSQCCPITYFLRDRKKNPVKLQHQQEYLKYKRKECDEIQENLKELQLKIQKYNKNQDNFKNQQNKFNQRGEKDQNRTKAVPNK